MDIEYQQFEERLARLHEVADGDRTAFKGRLRFLRDMGVPDKQARGSGKRLKFAPVDLWDTHVALTLSEFGLPPLRVSMAIKQLRKQASFEKVLMREADQLWLVVILRSNVGKAQDIDDGNFQVIANICDTKEVLGQLNTCGYLGLPQLLVINATQLLKGIGG
jgi:hypothetical protein